MLEWKLPSSRPGLTGYIDRNQPHAINSILIGKLGNQEILVCACDDGDVVAYYTSTIQRAIDGPPLGLTVEQRLRPLLLTNIEKSAWGLAIHSNARLIAASSNKHDITVFSFALTEDAILRGESPDPDKIDAIKLNSRERDTEFILCGHSHNIPNISFLNADSDIEGRYLVSTDLTGTMLIWDLQQRCGIKRMPPIEDNRSVNSRSGWSVVCVDMLSAQYAESPQELLGFLPSGVDGNVVDITSSRNTLRDSALTSTSFYRPVYRRTIDNRELDYEERVEVDEAAAFLDFHMIERAFTEDDLAALAMDERFFREDDLAAFTEDQGDWPDEEDEVDYEDEMEEVVWENGTATDPRPSLLEQGFITANGESVNLPRPINTDAMPWRELSPSPSEPSTQPPQNPTSPSRDTHTAGEALRRTSGLTRALRSGDIITEHLLSQQQPDQTFRRATQHPQLRSYTQSLADVRSEHNRLKSKMQARAQEAQAEAAANLDLPFAIFHTGVDYVNLHRPPFDKTSIVTCRDPCHQHLPPNLVWLSQVDRLHLTQYIPDIDVIVTATAAGRAAVFSFTRGVLPVTTKNKGKNVQQPPEIAMRLDWVLPFTSQEERSERPPMVLIGIATAPLQGLDESPDTAGPSGSGVKRRAKARWRLFLTYEDHTVLSYELWRSGKGKIGERVGMEEEGMVF